MSLDLLYPRKCPFCARLLPEEEPGDICPACRRDLPWTRGGGKTKGSFFSLCVSPLTYAGKAREALLRFKFRGRRAYARCFGRLMADCVRENVPWELHTVSYVPLHWLRFRKRGYSQSRLLAGAVAAELGLPCVPLLRKTRAVRPLSGMGAGDRRRTAVSGAFAFRPSEEGAAAGKNVLLTDDVVTSGATLSECSRVLLTAGAERVVCVTLCRAAGGENKDLSAEEKI